MSITSFFGNSVLNNFQIAALVFFTPGLALFRPLLIAVLKVTFFAHVKQTVVGAYFLYHVFNVAKGASIGIRINS
jgi:hypothetical protein